MKTSKILGNSLYQRSILNMVLIAALFLAVTLSPLAHSHGQGTDQSAAVVAATAEQKNLAKQLTQQLGKLIAEYKAAGTASSSELANQLTTLAEERQQLLGQLIENDPAEVLRQALPDEVLDHMPAKAQAFLEQHRAMEGELQLLHVDYKDQSQSHYVYLLSTDTGEHYSLHFANHGPDIQSGSRVRVNGLALYGVKTRDAGETEGAVAVEDGSANVLVLAADGSTTMSTAATSTTTLSNTFGEQKTLVILINFQDQSTLQPVTTDQVRSLVFGTVSDFYRENSFNQTWLTGNVYGWYTIPVNSTICDTTSIKSEADKAAASAGADLSQFTRFVYMFPTTNACPWAGLAWVGGSPSQAFINGVFSLRVVGHELGHNLGLLHAHGLNCDTSPLGANCSNLETGDRADIMGGRAGHFNAYHKELLGWLNSSSMPPITTVETDGSYTLEPYELNSLNPKALKILKSTDLTTGKKIWYYLEYRQPLGFDSILNGVGNLASGVSIRTGSETYTVGSYQLDMTPNSNATSGYGDLEDSALAVGQIFTDSTAGVTITVPWAGSTGAGIDVTIGQPCGRNNPSVSLSPSQGSAVAAGTPITYTVTVTNTDSAACGVSTFNLQAGVSTGWTGVFAASALTVGAGSTASTSLTVTSPTSAADGSYTIGSNAINSANTSYTGTASASYTIGSLNTVVITDKTSYAKGSTVTITGKATEGGTPVANVNMTFAITKPNSAVIVQTATTDSSGQAVYKLRLSRQKDPAGVYPVSVSAASGEQTAVALTSFTVQ